MVNIDAVVNSHSTLGYSSLLTQIQSQPACIMLNGLFDLAAAESTVESACGSWRRQCLDMILYFVDVDRSVKRIGVAVVGGLDGWK